MPGIVFLMYHELETPGRALCDSEPGYVRYVLRAEEFRAQMELLKSRGWKGVSVGNGLDSHTEKTVVITFDDGSETDLLTAAPILREFGFGATFFITAGWSGNPRYLSHAQLRELSTLGFEIGCHSMTHAYLTDLDETGLRREIVEAKLQLEQVIGKPVEHFSCPGGRCDSRAVRIARAAGYRTVCTSEARANHPATDHFSLGRMAIMRSTPLPKFFEICRGRGLWYGQLAVRLRTTVRNLLGNSNYDRLRATILRKRS